MMLRMTNFDLEPIYVVGPFEEFLDTIQRRLDTLRDSGTGGVVTLTHVSHALAIAPNGETHWSALLSGTVTSR